MKTDDPEYWLAERRGHMWIVRTPAEWSAQMARAVAPPQTSVGPNSVVGGGTAAAGGTVADPVGTTTGGGLIVSDERLLQYDPASANVKYVVANEQQHVTKVRHSQQDDKAEQTSQAAQRAAPPPPAVLPSLFRRAPQRLSGYLGRRKQGSTTRA